jgi:two-component system response regulator AtoC
VFPIVLPPLRTRKEDIPETARHLLGHVAVSCGLVSAGISDEAMSALESYDWPGNVRELRNILERGLVLAGGGTIELDHLPVELQEGRLAEPGEEASLQARVDHFKRELLLECLKSAGWSKKDAAAKLGLTQRAMSHYVAKYDLDRFRNKP